MVAPGFIDMLGQSEYNVLVDPRAASKITQGITTEITGEGSSIAPRKAGVQPGEREVFEHYGVTPDFTTLAGYFAAFEKARPAINLGTFVGAGGVRGLVAGTEDRRVSSAELARMEALVAAAMEDGALGLSTSLQYVPDRFLSTEEIVALAKVARRYGGSYITHQRSESYKIDESLDEAFRVAREAAIPTQVYHLKTAYRPNWGRMPQVLKRFEQARAEGLDVSADQYPYTAGQNGLDANLPIWVREGGTEKMLARLADPAARARVKAELRAGGPELGEPVPRLRRRRGDPDRERREPGPQEVRGAADRRDRAGGGERRGRRRDGHRGRGPGPHLEHHLHHGRGRRARGAASPARVDVHRLERLGHRRRLLEGALHPRAWGSAARILGRYVRDEKLLPLEEAVRKMTSLPASRMGLADRGIVRPGLAADLVVFDPARVRDASTYEDPLRYSEGIPYVAVNGRLVVDGGRITDARPGRPIYGPGRKAR